jgi:hypothetical protein
MNSCMGGTPIHELAGRRRSSVPARLVGADFGRPAARLARLMLVARSGLAGFPVIANGLSVRGDTVPPWRTNQTSVS